MYEINCFSPNRIKAWARKIGTQVVSGPSTS